MAPMITAIATTEGGNGLATLDEAYAVIQAGNVASGLNHLFEGLRTLRASVPGPAWRAFTQRYCAVPPLREVVNTSPFTSRAWRKPRGYAGDAGTIDYAYELASRAFLTELGQSVAQWEFETSSCRSVRGRRDLLARSLDEVAATIPHPQILPVACGHLREAQRSDAVRDRKVRRFVALDHDRAALAVVQRELGPSGIEAVHGTVRQFLTHRYQQLGRFDLIYAAGLYDYLTAPVATALTTALFALLESGGRLLLANFTPSLRDSGYMEAYMEWYLVYRDEPAMLALLAGVDSHAVLDCRSFRDPSGNLVYLDIHRR